MSLEQSNEASHLLPELIPSSTSSSSSNFVTLSVAQSFVSYPKTPPKNLDFVTYPQTPSKHRDFVTCPQTPSKTHDLTSCPQTPSKSYDSPQKAHGSPGSPSYSPSASPSKSYSNYISLNYELEKNGRQQKGSHDPLVVFRRKVTCALCIILSIIGIALGIVLYPRVPVVWLTSETMGLKSGIYPNLQFNGSQELRIRNPNIVYDVIVRNITFHISYGTYGVIGHSNTLGNLSVSHHHTGSFLFNFNFTELSSAVSGSLFLDCRAYRRVTFLFNGRIWTEYGLNHADLSFANFSFMIPCT